MKRFCILRETGTAVSDTCMEETVTDSRIHTHTFRNGFNIGAYQLAKIRNFVYIRNLQSKEIIGSIFDHLCASAVGIHKRLPEILVYFCQNIPGTVCFRTYNDTCGFKGIPYCRTLCKKFRVGSDINVNSGFYPGFDQLFYLIIGSDRNRRFNDYNTIFFNAFGNLFRNCIHISQIS